MSHWAADCGGVCVFVFVCVFVGMGVGRGEDEERGKLFIVQRSSPMIWSRFGVVLKQTCLCSLLCQGGDLEIQVQTSIKWKEHSKLSKRLLPQSVRTTNLWASRPGRWIQSRSPAPTRTSTPAGSPHGSPARPGSTPRVSGTSGPTVAQFFIFTERNCFIFIVKTVKTQIVIDGSESDSHCLLGWFHVVIANHWCFSKHDKFGG